MKSMDKYAGRRAFWCFKNCEAQDLVHDNYDPYLVFGLEPYICRRTNYSISYQNCDSLVYYVNWKCFFGGYDLNYLKMFSLLKLLIHV